MLDPAESDTCARYLRAIADPDRLQIIQILRSGPRHVSDLVQEMGKSMANVSHHLKILRQAGLVTTRREGKYIRYALDENYFSLPKKKEESGIRLDLGCCQLDMPDEP